MEYASYLKKLKYYVGVSEDWGGVGEQAKEVKTYMLLEMSKRLCAKTRFEMR